MTQQDENLDQVLNQDQQDYINELVRKARVCMEKTKPNCGLKIGDLACPIKVDDHELLYIGVSLLPNIMNYLVNILPQLLYPYVVAYLQDLSELGRDPVTIHDIFTYFNQQNHGNILDGTQAES